MTSKRCPTMRARAISRAPGAAIGLLTCTAASISTVLAVQAAVAWVLLLLIWALFPARPRFVKPTATAAPTTSVASASTAATAAASGSAAAALADEAALRAEVRRRIAR